MENNKNNRFLQEWKKRNTENKMRDLSNLANRLLKRAGFTEEEIKNNIKFKTSSKKYGEPCINVYNGTELLGCVFMSRSGNPHHEGWGSSDPRQTNNGESSRHEEHGDER